MKVSVVLTTYNGEKYLYELLNSLRNQTYQINEVLICDDGSSDSTQEIIAGYIKKYHLRHWVTIFNSPNKGWKKNFRDGLLMAKGDLVFPCDQDDIWEENKIERMITIMGENENIQLLSSDYLPVYETGGQVVEKIYSASGTLVKVPFDSHFASGNRPGCVMCIRRELIEKTRPIWEEWYPHDAFLWTVSIFMNGCYIIHEPLIRYRRHSGNTTNRVTRDKEAVILSLKRNRNLSDWLINNPNIPSSEDKKDMLKQFKNYANIRIELLEQKKVSNFVKLIRYRCFYRTFKQQLGDLYLMVKISQN